MSLPVRVLVTGPHHNTLIPGYTARHHPPHHPSLQDIAVNTFHGPMNVDDTSKGICAVITVLVMTCCRRFNCHKPWLISNHIKRVILDELQTHGEMEMFRRNLVRWYTSIYRINTIPRMLQRLGLNSPLDEPHRICMLFSDKTEEPCKRRACNLSALCWQHRYLMLNRWNANRKKCTDPIAYHRFRALPQNPKANQHPVVPIDVDADQTSYPKRPKKRSKRMEACECGPL